MQLRWHHALRPCIRPALRHGCVVMASVVCTPCRYNVVTFVPRFLFEQFSQVAYFYFLVQVRAFHLTLAPAACTSPLQCLSSDSGAYLPAGATHWDLHVVGTQETP
jgi:Phospholipid-translocating ATPase N-terminal